MGSPVPSKSNNAAENSAMLTMAYFHPWTLRGDEEEGGMELTGGRVDKNLGFTIGPKKNHFRKTNRKHDTYQYLPRGTSNVGAQLH